MITTANYIIKAVVNGSTYFFEYDDTMDIYETMEKFWHEDYPEVLAEVQGSELFPMDVYAMSENGSKVIATYPFTFNAAVFHAFYDHGHKADGPYTENDFMGDILRKEKNYGMTIQYICDRIAEFTGDKKKEAMRKAKVFRANCCVPLTEIKDLHLVFGKYSDSHGNYYGENRDTLHFYYKDSDGETHAFTIMD